MSLISVNGDDLTSLGVTLVDFSPGSFVPDNSYLTRYLQIPLLFQTRQQLRTLSVTMEVCGATPEQTMQHISQVTAKFIGTCEIALPDGFIYSAVLTGLSAPERTTECMQDITATFLAARHGALQTITITGSGTVNNPGTAPAACRLKFIPSAAGDYTVFGYDLSDLAANKQVVIDGISPAITQDGNNIWGNTSLMAFPCLQPGANSISISPSESLTIEYYPMYL